MVSESSGQMLMLRKIQESLPNKKKDLILFKL